MVRMAYKTAEMARTRDPLPGLREVVAGQERHNNYNNNYYYYYYYSVKWWPG